MSTKTHKNKGPGKKRPEKGRYFIMKNEIKNEIMENENKGFSLVELIVVIAIMAVLTSVLAPSLLGYVEKSRMQKDDSAMGEVANAIQLALADQNVYDECLVYNVSDNYSCYADGDTATNIAANKLEDKNRGTTAGTVEDADDWHYTDNARLKDETPYTPDGKMRGMTITFSADAAANDTKITLANAAINNIPGATAEKIDATKQTTLGAMTTAGGQAGQLYSRLRSVIGENVALSSQTYRNSDYTVFIRMGSMGGNDISKQDAVAVYGQWSGTNLA